jgi:hypothetical protein
MKVLINFALKHSLNCLNVKLKNDENFEKFSNQIYVDFKHFETLIIC